MSLQKRGLKKPASDRVEFPKNKDGSLDKDKVYQLFMASSHLEWGPFAQSQGWDRDQSYARYPTSTWVSEKKKSVAKRQAEEIGEQLFNHRSRWHKSALKALKECPEMNEFMVGLLKRRMAQYGDMARRDDEAMRNRIQLIQAGTPPELLPPIPSSFAGIPDETLQSLANSVRVMTDSWYKSLLLSEWSVKLAEQFTTPEGVMEAEDQQPNKEWVFEMIGGERIQKHDMHRMMAQWYDKPIEVQALPEPENAPG